MKALQVDQLTTQSTKQMHETNWSIKSFKKSSIASIDDDYFSHRYGRILTESIRLFVHIESILLGLSCRLLLNSEVDDVDSIQKGIARDLDLSIDMTDAEDAVSQLRYAQNRWHIALLMHLLLLESHFSWNSVKMATRELDTLLMNLVVLCKDDFAVRPVHSLNADPARIECPLHVVKALNEFAMVQQDLRLLTHKLDFIVHKVQKSLTIPSEVHEMVNVVQEELLLVHQRLKMFQLVPSLNEIEDLPDNLEWNVESNDDSPAIACDQLRTENEDTSYVLEADEHVYEGESQKTTEKPSREERIAAQKKKRQQEVS